MPLYAIQNMLNGKMYIGKTVRLMRERWNHHRYDYHRKDYPLYRAMRKNGIDNFQLIILSESTDNEELLRQEVAYIKLFGTMDSELGYNMHAGDAGVTRCIVSEETRDKLRRINIGRKFSVESRKRMSDSAKKRVFTPELREKICRSVSEAHKGKPQSSEWIAKRIASKLQSSKGYTFQRGKWYAYILNRHLGVFDTEEQAKAARLEAVNKEISNVPPIC